MTEAYSRNTLAIAVSSYLVFSCCLFAQNSAVSAVGSQTAATSQPTPPFITELKETILIVHTTCTVNGVAGDWFGTGFVVGVPSLSNPELTYTYLVTNRHVAQPGIEHHGPCTDPTYSVDLNVKVDPKQAESQLLHIPVQLKWCIPNDPSVDLAVTPFGVDWARVRLRFIPRSLFANSDLLRKQQVIEGHQLLYAGASKQFIGTAHVEPLIRQGILSLIPDEKRVTTLDFPGFVYLAELHVFHGNSGSPVYIDLNGDNGGAFTLGHSYKLLGVLSGYVPEGADLTIGNGQVLHEAVEANSGIAEVVPIDKLEELLDLPEFRDARGKVPTVGK